MFAPVPGGRSEGVGEIAVMDGYLAFDKLLSVTAPGEEVVCDAVQERDDVDCP